MQISDEEEGAPAASETSGHVSQRTRIETAQEQFVCPAGYSLVARPKRDQRSDSKLWSCGVRVVKNSADQAGPDGFFFCLVDSCFNEHAADNPFERGHRIRVQKGNTANASLHLAQKHNVMSDSSLQRKRRKADDVAAASQASAVEASMASSRFWLLKIALLVIRQLLPFSFVETSDFREQTKCPVLMSVKMLKRAILEIYIATKSQIVSALAKVKRECRSLPCFHLNVDLWTSKISGSKYLGVRLFFVDSLFNYRSYVLAVKPFNPSSAIRKSHRLSDIIFTWVRDVLHEFGLSLNDLMSATTDAGSDIKRFGDVLLDCKWEWCLCHMLNCALVEAFGSQVDPKKSTNKAARALISRAKKMIEHCNKSHPTQVQLKEIQASVPFARDLKLLGDVPQRWKSTVKLLDRLLLLWSTVRKLHSDMLKAFPIESDHQSLLELFSIMQPVAFLLTDAQSGSFPVAPLAVAQLSHLRKTVLNLSARLQILDPEVKANDPTLPPVYVAAENLTEVARDTRKLLLEAITSRFFNSYTYERSQPNMLDLCCFLYPPLAKMTYVIHLLSPEEQASHETLTSRFREETEQEIARLATQVLEQAGDGPRLAAASSSGTALAPAPASTTSEARRQAAGRQGAGAHPSFHGEHLHAVRLSIMDSCSSELAMTADRACTDPSTIVKEELTRYKQLAERVTVMHLPTEEVLKFWREKAWEYPILSVVARAVLGFAIGAAAIERDFSVAGNLVTRKRGSLSDCMVEVCLFNNINADEIPAFNTIPTLAAHIRLGMALPDRFKNSQYKAVLDLSSTQINAADDQSDCEDDDDDDDQDDNGLEE